MDAAAKNGGMMLPDVVYVIGGDGTPMKIGVSTDPQRRAVALQAGAMAQLSVLFELRDPFARKIEAVVHKALASKRLHGEWFTITLDQAISAIEAAKRKIDQPSFHIPQPKKRGRRGPEARHEDLIKVRISSNAKHHLERLAETDGLTLSEFVRRSLEQTIKGDA